jgi:hypothetical protein
MKPTLVMTIGMLVLSLITGNSITFYYGQLLPHPNMLTNMALNASLVIALFLFAQKVSSWLK